MVYTDLIWGGIIARPLHNEGGNLVPLWLFTWDVSKASGIWNSHEPARASQILCSGHDILWPSYM